MERKFPDGKTLGLVLGDITTIHVDAIVNAANSELQGGGGVDGAIHRAAGPQLMFELIHIRARSGKCPPGSAVVTSAGALPAHYVFHAVGPIYRDGAHGEPEFLASCYRQCLQLAEEREIHSISFPAISTGVYRYPPEDAALIAIGTVGAHLQRPDTKVREVLLVLFDQVNYGTHARVLSSMFPEPLE